MSGQEIKRIKGDKSDWKKALPNDISHIDSIKDYSRSIAYKKINGELIEAGSYYHNSNYGTII